LSEGEKEIWEGERGSENRRDVDERPLMLPIVSREGCDGWPVPSSHLRTPRPSGNLPTLIINGELDALEAAGSAAIEAHAIIRTCNRICVRG
jgi:hypothetical protein